MRNTLRVYRLLLGRHRDSARAIISGRPPVILLCGWGGTRHTLADLEGRLEADGFAPYVFPLGGILGRFNARGIDELALRLERHLSSLAMSFPKLRISIVGHSMGGIIGRYLVSMLGGARFVHTLVTLGSPHRGSPVAEFFVHTAVAKWSRAIEQLRPSSPLLIELSRHRIPDETFCASLYSREDRFCPPPCAEMGIPADCDNIENIDAGDLGHLEFIVSGDAYSLIREQLQRGLARAGLR